MLILQTLLLLYHTICGLFIISTRAHSIRSFMIRWGSSKLYDKVRSDHIMAVEIILLNCKYSEILHAGQYHTRLFVIIAYVLCTLITMVYTN